MQKTCSIMSFYRWEKNIILTIYDMKFVSETPKPNALSACAQATKNLKGEKNWGGLNVTLVKYCFVMLIIL